MKQKKHRLGTGPFFANGGVAEVGIYQFQLIRGSRPFGLLAGARKCTAALKLLPPKRPLKRLRCVPSMFDSLGVKVPYPT